MESNYSKSVSSRTKPKSQHNVKTTRPVAIILAVNYPEQQYPSRGTQGGTTEEEVPQKWELKSRVGVNYGIKLGLMLKTCELALKKTRYQYELELMPMN